MIKEVEVPVEVIKEVEGPTKYVTKWRTEYIDVPGETVYVDVPGPEVPVYDDALWANTTVTKVPGEDRSTFDWEFFLGDSVSGGFISHNETFSTMIFSSDVDLPVSGNLLDIVDDVSESHPINTGMSVPYRSYHMESGGIDMDSISVDFKNGRNTYFVVINDSTDDFLLQEVQDISIKTDIFWGSTIDQQAYDYQAKHEQADPYPDWDRRKDAYADGLLIGVYNSSEDETFDEDSVFDFKLTNLNTGESWDILTGATYSSATAWRDEQTGLDWKIFAGPDPDLIGSVRSQIPGYNEELTNQYMELIEGLIPTLTADDMLIMTASVNGRELYTESPSWLTSTTVFEPPVA